MSKKEEQARSVRYMKNAAETLSEMLAHTVTEARRIQKQKEKALGRRYATQNELAENYDTKTMKELTAILKDITAVVKALEENAPGEGAGSTGVVLLPPVALPENDAALPENGKKEPETASAPQNAEMEITQSKTKMAAPGAAADAKENRHAEGK